MNGHAGTNGSSSSSQLQQQQQPATNDVNLDEMEYDPLQLEMMKEELIVVDYDDKPIGQESKKTCACGRRFSVLARMRAPAGG